MNRSVRSVLYGFGLLALCHAVSGCDSADWNVSASAEAREAPPKGKTLGFVVADNRYSYEAEDVEAKCPDGLVYSNREQWEAQFPTQAARQQHLDRCGDPLYRGPNCENVWLNPQVIEDPLPYREAQGKIAYGLNLDGTPDGRETATTCAHEKFTNPDGVPGIDNQYYRFIGCENYHRANSTGEERRRRVIARNRPERRLLEISGLDDEKNDDAVEVAMYMGVDPLVVDAEEGAVPWQSQRIDEGPDGGPRGLVFRARGRIVDGVLMTEPVDLMWSSFFGVLTEPKLLIRGAMLRLKLTPTGVEGVLGGYTDLEQMWEGYSKGGARLGSLLKNSGPSAYAALYRLADGYKDPETGVCTALSSARYLRFVPAHVIHPSSDVASKEAGP